jgi:hypothetical protein
MPVGSKPAVENPPVRGLNEQYAQTATHYAGKLDTASSIKFASVVSRCLCVLFVQSPHGRVFYCGLATHWRHSKPCLQCFSHKNPSSSLCSIFPSQATPLPDCTSSTQSCESLSVRIVRSIPAREGFLLRACYPLETQLCVEDAGKLDTASSAKPSSTVSNQGTPVKQKSSIPLHA